MQFRPENANDRWPSMSRARTRCFFVLLLFIIGTCLQTGCQPNPSTPNPNDVPTKDAKPKATDANEDGVKQTAAPKPLAPSFKQVVPGSLVEFEMLLVPAEKKTNQKPFYLGKHEVKWDEFAYWALCEDISEKKGVLQRDKKLRPSSPHDTESIYRGWGRNGQPAVGVSRLSAQRYCEWLSEKTGKTFRLPTTQEWEYAFVQGGHAIDEQLDADVLDKLAWHAENSFNPDTFDNQAMPAGQKAPNQLGIYDMLGNVAEWVADGDPHVRGGSFLTPAKDLRGSWSDTEDQTVWNRNYPNDPKSIWWYVDADYVGFRILCEPPQPK